MRSRVLVWTAALLAPGAEAATFHVDPAGPFSTIQAAIDTAASGDTLILAAATYAENPLIVREDLCIRAGPGAEAIIDGAPGADVRNAGNTLRTVSSFVRLEDIVLRNGTARVGAGVMIFGGRVEMRRCRLENNRFGALSVGTGVPGVIDLQDCEVVGNGIGVEGRRLTRLVRSRFADNLLAVRTAGQVEFVDLEVVGNGAPAAGDAGALVLGNSFGRLERVVVRDNWSNISSGGIWMSLGPFELRDCEVENNQSEVGVAGIGIDLVPECTLVRCTVRGNRTTGPHLGVAGLLVHRSSVRATDCRFEHNDSIDSGGGVSVQLHSNLELARSTVLGNVSSGKGGGVFVSRSSVRLDEVVVAGNVAPAGGGVAAENAATLEIRACTLAANEAQVGGGLFLLGGPVLVERSILAFHPETAAVFCQADATFECVDVFGNADDSLCGVELGGILSVDPAFCALDPAAGQFDLRLSSASPVADAPGGCGRLGALPLGCEATSVKSITWSGLKTVYR
ncbi:MAG: right-handed parallel beta-helix repeat-containing protein [Candidatus Krumholzibacteriia bacterium]